MLDSRACEVLLSKIRDAKTGHTDYVYYADRLLRLGTCSCDQLGCLVDDIARALSRRHR